MPWIDGQRRMGGPEIEYSFTIKIRDQKNGIKNSEYCFGMKGPF